MILKAIVNNNKEYYLTRWNSLDFNANMTLYIQTVDLVDVKNTFEAINKIDILSDDIQVATYTSFDSYASITFLGNEYVEGEKKFAETMAVTLTKANIVDQIQRLDDKINPVIDVDNMTLEEYKAYVIGLIHEAVQNDIYNGTQVVMSDGTVETFQFTTEDQLDITNLWNVIIASGGKVEALPFHSHGNECRMYDILSIISLYIEMQKWITEKTTIANFAIVKARAAQTKEELNGIYYGMEFDAETQEKIVQILTSTLNVINVVLEQLHILIPDTPSDEPEEDPQSGEDDDDENIEPFEPIEEDPSEEDPEEE